MWLSISCRFLRKSHLDSTAMSFNTLLIIKYTVKLKCAYQYLKRSPDRQLKYSELVSCGTCSTIYHSIIPQAIQLNSWLYRLLDACEILLLATQTQEAFEQLCSQLLFAVHIPQDSCLFMYEILRLIRQGWTLYVNEILKQQQAKSIEQWFYLFQVLKAACNVSTSIY